MRDEAIPLDHGGGSLPDEPTFGLTHPGPRSCDRHGVIIPGRQDESWAAVLNGEAAVVTCLAKLAC
jgi:hypothetical protein